ncbi:MAG TPA: acyl-CoA dehydrogenase family protein [Myxococcota bacterium]|jgi:alkylation response protein AidB-like acyl-CoA dehydrogenase
MHLHFSQQDEAFRREIAAWLERELGGEFRALRGAGGPGNENALVEERRVWERRLGAAGYACIGWPQEWGGRGASLTQQVIFHEEYARARGPGRLGHIGEGLLGPTLLAFGTDAQKRRFLPAIARGEEIWCQGYSEPNAGSDLANVQTRTRLEGDSWILDGQKVWTSWAQWADFCFVLCRSDPEAPKHKGLSYLLVPMRQPGIEVRPILQLTGDSEFSEVFFNGARCEAANIVGRPGDGWKVAMGTLAFERGASTLGQNLSFRNELEQVIQIAKRNGKDRDPVLRGRLADAWIGLEVMRMNALRMLSGGESPELPREALIYKLYWASWHQSLGELAMDVLGDESAVLEGPGYELGPLQRLFLFTRSDTIYGGSNEIQRNIIAERGLGLPREPRVERKP